MRRVAWSCCDREEGDGGCEININKQREMVALHSSHHHPSSHHKNHHLPSSLPRSRSRLMVRDSSAGNEILIKIDIKNRRKRKKHLINK